MQSCYVAMPFGQKLHPESGTAWDFDALYFGVIKPAVAELGLRCRRLDEFEHGAIWHKTMLEAIIASDLMIADLSLHNPNVLYEVGIRHALRRGRTVLITAGGPPPWNLSFTRTLFYQRDGSGRLADDEAFRLREALQATIRQSQRTIISDSPIYEFFPDLEVMLPPQLVGERTPRHRTVGPAQGFAQGAVESPAQAYQQLRVNEALVRSTPEADPLAYLTLLRKYRDLGAWDRLVALAEDAPALIANSPEVRQMLALALNRRSEPGDQERAIALMEELVAETGGDGETFGILGRIYKDRYDQAKARGDRVAASANLKRALQHYRAGFDADPRDYYPGVNVVTLLLQQGDEAARKELNAVIPRVRAVVQEKLDAGPPTFWDLVTNLQLAVAARDWAAAESAARAAMEQSPSSWLLETTVRDLQGLRDSFSGADRKRVDAVIEMLEEGVEKAEAV